MSLRARIKSTPVVALALGVLGLQLTASHMTIPLGNYDEGLLVTDAFALSRGQIPFRDFYSNYPPGSLLLVRACALLSGGATIHAMRMLAFGIRVAGAFLAAVLVGRMTRGRGRAATFAAVLLLQSQVSLTMFAYVTAVTVALGALVALPSDMRDRRRFALSGALFGLVSWFRHDVFVYVVFFGALAVVVARLARRPLLATIPRDGRRAFATSVLAVVLPFWIPVLLLGGPSQVVHDLALDQTRYIQPARVLPMPSFHGEQSVDLLHWSVPVYLADFTRLELIALAAALFVGAARFTLHLRGAAVGEDRRILAACVLALAAATAPQALQRTDSFHVGYGAPATLACLFGAIGAVPALGAGALLVAFLPVVANKPSLAAPSEILSLFTTRPDGDYIPGDRGAVRDAVDRLTKPDDRIFVGCTSHARLIIDDVSLYYESRRLGATRIQQFDPGVVTRDDVQQRMIDEIQAHHAKAVVLSNDCLWDEPNASKEPGSSRLDRWLKEHYVTAKRIGGFQIMRPAPP